MTRKPQQQRSRATVDAIIEAGFICVAEHGTADTTTRQIADVAGISVGSLYEYFSDKDMIFAAMNQRFVDAVVARLQPMMIELVRMSIGDAIRTMLTELEKLLRENNNRYLKCAHQAMHVDIKDYVAPINKLLTELVMQYLLHHPELMKLHNIPAMSYIFINGGIYSIVRHMSDPAPPITFEELAQGLANMVEHHVRGELAIGG